MNTQKNYEIETQSYRIADDILNCYNGYKTFFGIDDVTLNNNRFVFELKLLPGTSKIEDIIKYSKNVQMALKLPLFQVHQKGIYIYIVAAYNIEYNNELMPHLKSPVSIEKTKGMRLPYLVGFDYMGEPVIIDLSKLPNLISGGTSNSGKTVALLCLIIGLLWSCSPDKVKIVILDNGAADLIDFKGLCTVIDDTLEGHNTIDSLKKLMEYRISLKKSNRAEFEELPYIVVIVDELPALITESGENQNQLIENLQTLLNRCRHANMSVVLTAQNPTKENLGVDLGAVAARMAFICAKPVNSTTILGEGGAEELEVQGDMLFSAPQLGKGIQQYRGSFIELEDVPAVLDEIRQKHGIGLSDAAYKLDFSELKSKHSKTNTEGDATDGQFDIPVTPILLTTKSQSDDKLLVKIIIWALGQRVISANSISKAFKMKWDRANEFLGRLNQFGIATEFEGNSRLVTQNEIEDLEEEVILFLKQQGYLSEEDTMAVIANQGGIAP